MPRVMLSRRKWFELTALNTLACIGLSRRSAAQSTVATLRENRIRRIIHVFEDQGFHRTGTSVDRASANWLREEARAAGLTASLEPFSIQRVDPLASALIVSDRRLDGIPLFDAAFTNEHGIRGRLGSLESDAEIGLAETIPNAAGAGPLGDARRKNRHKATHSHGNDAAKEPGGVHTIIAPDGRDISVSSRW